MTRPRLPCPPGGSAPLGSAAHHAGVQILFTLAHEVGEVVEQAQHATHLNGIRSAHQRQHRHADSQIVLGQQHGGGDIGGSTHGRGAT